MKKKDESFELGRLAGIDEIEQKEKETHLVPQELMPYSDGQLFCKAKIFQEVEALGQMEAAGQRSLAIARVEIGKRLILLHEMAGIPILRGGNRHSESFKSEGSDLKREIETRFPWISLQRKSEYIGLARLSVENERFKKWLEGGISWTRGLVVADLLEEKKQKALSSGKEEIEIDFDEIDKLSYSELKDEIRRLKKKEERGKEQLKQKEAEIARMQRQWKPTEKQFHVVLEGYRVHFDSLLSQIEPEAMKERLGSYPDDPEKEEPSNRMIAHYIEIMRYIKNCAQAAMGEAEDSYGTAEMFPEKVWRPGMGAEIVEELRQTLPDEEYRKRKAAAKG